MRGVVVSVCPSPPAPHDPAEVKSHSARKKQNSIHMATHMFLSTRVDGAGPTFGPLGSFEDQPKSPYTPNCLKTGTNRKDKGS